MAEPVGRNCECIYAFEKHYVEMALNDWIERQKEEIQKNKRLIEEEEKKGPLSGLAKMLQDIIPAAERIIYDVEIVKERFAAMPTCK